MRAFISRIGNSQGIIIPKPVLAQIGINGINNEVDMTVESDAIVIRKPRPAVRAGWADESKAIAEAGDGELVWPDVPNEADRNLVW
jgi:antitoxin MazE